MKTCIRKGAEDKLARTICLATWEFEPITPVGGIGTYYNELAKLLLTHGWDVSILFDAQDLKRHGNTGDARQRAEAHFEKYGIRVYTAEELIEDSGLSYAELLRDTHWSQARSHIFHEAIQTLFNKHRLDFDLIEFPDTLGRGFIPLQMKKSFGNYGHAKIIVKLHGPSEWVFEGSGIDSADLDDLKLRYFEQYSFENADIQTSPTQHLLQWCSEHGWNIRSDATICRYPYRSVLPAKGIDDSTKSNEIVFFGRFERLKGIEDFIEALQYIRKTDPRFPTNYRVTFIGKQGYLSPESVSKPHDIAQKLDGYELTFLELNRDEAVRYLAEKGRLVVLPSRLDNFPYVVIACMLDRIPFVTSRSGGIPEMLGVGSELYEAVSSNLNDPRNLGSLIQNYMGYSRDRVQKLLALAYERGKSITDPNPILNWYEQHLHEERHIPVSPDKEGVAVTIIVPTQNSSRQLATTLKTLMNQTHKNIVIIILDSSSGPEARVQTDQLAEAHGATVVHSADLEYALSQVLSYVKTKYVICFEAGSMAKHNMVETFVRCAERREGIAALSSHHAIFPDDEKALAALESNCEREYSPRYNRPIGPCIPALFFQNIQGDQNSIYLTDALRVVGGWSERKAELQTWGLWLELIAAGYNIDVIPEVLYHRSSSQNRPSQENFAVDSCNVPIIQEMIKRRPELFAAIYPGIHQLLRDQAEKRLKLRGPWGLIERYIVGAQEEGLSRVTANTIKWFVRTSIARASSCRSFRREN